MDANFLRSNTRKLAKQRLAGPVLGSDTLLRMEAAEKTTSSASLHGVV
jgi:hypothetical protein